MRRVDTAAFYKWGSFYWHSRVSTIPIPPEPDPGIPIDPCTLCPEGYNCENGECVKPPEPGGGGGEIINPQIIPPDKEIAEDTPENEEVECVLLSQTRNWIVRYENGYITWADEFSWGRYKISSECYSWVIMEWKIWSTSSTNNYLLFWYWQESKTIAAGWRYQDLIKWDTRIRVTINAEDYSYTISVRNKISETVQTDWITIETWTFLHEQWDTSGWMIVWVYWAAVIFTTMANETSWVVPVSVDTVPEVLPSSATWVYPRSSVSIWWTTTDENWNTVRTKRFFTFIDWQEYEDWLLKYEWWVLKALPYASATFWEEQYIKSTNGICSSYWDVVFKSRYPYDTNNFGIGFEIPSASWEYVASLTWIYSYWANIEFGWTSYAIDSTKDYRLFREWCYYDDRSTRLTTSLYKWTYTTNTWTLVASSTDYYDNEAYDGWSDHWHINLSVANSSSDDWWVDIIYASTASVSCNQVVYASDRWTITHNYIDKTISIADNSWHTALIYDRNVWATDIYQDGDQYTTTNIWKVYQWWNWYWWDYNGVPSASHATVCANLYWPQNPYQVNQYIDYCQWDNCRNIDLWWWDSAPLWDLNNLLLNTNIPNWFHIPTAFEAGYFLDLCNNIMGLWDPSRRSYEDHLNAEHMYWKYLFMPHYSAYWTSNNNWQYSYAFSLWYWYVTDYCPMFTYLIRPFKSINYGTTVYED